MTTTTFDLTGVRVPKRRRQPQASGGSDVDFPPIAVLPFSIVADTREQLPYEFSGMVTPIGDGLVVPVVSKGLPSGDYSIDGLEDQVAIERKSLEDLYGSVTWGRERFEREIARLNELSGFAAVVIEATWLEIIDPTRFWPDWSNQTQPASVEGTIIAWSIRYRNVHWWPCGDRRMAECRTFSILNKFWRERQ